MLVILQIALSLLVLVGAGLCTRSLRKLQQVDPGIEPSKVVLISFDLALNNYSSPRTGEFYDRLLERARTLPGVESAGLALVTPLSGWAPQTSVERVEGFQSGPREHPVGEFNLVSADYFRTLNLAVLRGRDFDSTDDSKAVSRVIINDAFVNRYWPGQDPIGKRIFQHGPDGGIPTEVVGVVKSSSSRALTDGPRPALYFPLTQRPDPALTLAVRTGLDPAMTIAALREVAKALDANVPIFRVRTLAQQKDGSLALQRMVATLLGGFGVLALLLASLGIYGVLAYSVSRRTREIGVRMALGAQISDILRVVMKQGLSLAAVGLGMGLMGSIGATRWLRSFLYQIEPLDPVTFIVSIGVLGAVILLACWLPARRAARVDPMVALRNE